MINKPPVNAGNDFYAGTFCTTTLSAFPNLTSSGYAYKWYKGTSNMAFSTALSPIIQVWGTSDFRVKITHTLTGCVNEDKVRVTSYGKCRLPYTSIVKAVPCAPGAARTSTTSVDQETLTVNTLIKRDTFYHKVITVPEGITLTIDSCELAMSSESEIVVEEGGKLIIRDTWVHDCGGTYWLGIRVVGNRTDANQLLVTGSVIEGAQNGLRADQTTGIIIDDNVFVAGNVGLDIRESEDFTVKNNRFHEMPVGLSTEASYAGTGSEIEANLFVDVTKALTFDNDDHSNLEIRCNQFNYDDYGIYSESTTLKDQGTTALGTGNLFNTSSAYTNHQLWHDGPSMTYYCDPTVSFTLSNSGGLSAYTQTATADGDCPRFTARGENVAQIKIPGETYAAELQVTVYPNPFEDKLTINYDLPQLDKQATFRIIEAASGKIIYHGKLNAGQKTMELNNLSLAAGLYICSVRTENGASKNFKLVKVN